MAFEAAPAAALLSKPDRKCNKGAWLRLDEALAEQSENEILYHFGCWVLQKKYLWSDQFHHNEELLFVVEAVLEERKNNLPDRMGRARTAASQARLRSRRLSSNC